MLSRGGGPRQFNLGAIGGAGGYGSLQDELQRAYEEARQANLKRYEDILGGYRGREADVMGLIGGIGAQRGADIRSQWGQAQAQGMQNLVSRGLAGTGVMPTIQRGYQRNQQADLNRLAETMAQLKGGFLSNLRGDTLQFQERRSDEYPDTSQALGLMQLQGQTGGGWGGGARRRTIGPRAGGWWTTQRRYQAPWPTNSIQRFRQAPGQPGSTLAQRNVASGMYGWNVGTGQTPMPYGQGSSGTALWNPYAGRPWDPTTGYGYVG